MKARIPKHREFVIDIKEEDEALQQEYQFEYTIELV